MYEKYLTDIGLSEKEAAVYIALLSFEKALVTEIAEKALIKRPTAYVILDTLAKKGLVSETNIGKKTFYLAEPPEKLALFIERQVHLLEENKKSLDLVIPQLKNLERENGEKPIVQFYDGKEGVLSSNEEIFSQKVGNEPAYVIYSRDLVKGIFTPEERRPLINKRINLGIKSKAIYTSTYDTIASNQEGDRIKIDDQKYPIKSDITIYGDKIEIALFGKRVSAIRIKNKEFADTLKSLIDYIFDNQK